MDYTNSHNARTSFKNDSALVRVIVRVTARRSPLRRGGREKFHIENQRLVWGNEPIAGTAGAIGEIGRDDQMPLVALPHQAERLGPARDELVDGELRRRQRLCTVEDFAVDQHAGVVDRDRVGRKWPLAEAVLQDAVL